MNATPLTDPQREALVTRIVERLTSFDDAALVELERVTDEAAYLAAGAPLGLPEGAAEEAARPLTRRQLVTGGVVVTLASLGTAFAVRGARASAGADASGLRTRLGLFERLDALGLDDALGAALDRLGDALAALSAAAGLLTAAVAVIERGLEAAEAGLAQVESGLGRLEALLDQLDARIAAVRGAFADGATDVVAGVGGFLDGLLERLPAAVADPLRAGATALRDLVAAAVDVLDEARAGLVGGLRGGWLPAAAAAGAAGAPGLADGLLVPLRRDGLAAARVVLERARAVEAEWRDQAQGLRTVLDARRALRGELAALEA